MEARERRNEIRREVEGAARPVTASALAKKLSCSRQVIVGDVALLRAEGFDIISTARGYVWGHVPQDGRFRGQLACRHSQEDTGEELYTIVDMGGHVLNVTVEHSLYGEITGQLGLTCRKDVDQFLERVSAGEARLLSELTDGVHLHAVSYRSEDDFRAIREALDKRGMIYTGM